MTDEFSDTAETPETASDEFAVASWTESFEPEDRDLIDVKGWRSPVDMLHSYRHLEQLVGSDTVRIPGAEADAEEVAGFWSKLGRPDAPDGYDIPTPPDMAAYSEDMASWFRDAAHECHMPLEMARRFHDKYVEKFIHETQALDTELAGERQRSDAELRYAWGDSYDRNKVLADRALRALGGDRLIEELRLSRLDSSAALAQAFAQIGERLYAEDGFLDADSGPGFGHSPVLARQEIQRLRADSAFMTVYGDRRHPEHEAAQQRMDQLYAVAREGS